MKLRLGNRVKVTNTELTDIGLNDRGTILCIKNKGHGDKIIMYGIEWDIHQGHDLLDEDEGKYLRPCEQGKGWWVHSRYIVLAEGDRHLYKNCTCIEPSKCPLCEGLGYIEELCMDEDNKLPGKEWKYVQTRKNTVG
jgi:hypothetical protein